MTWSFGGQSAASAKFKKTAINAQRIKQETDSASQVSVSVVCEISGERLLA